MTQKRYVKKVLWGQNGLLVLILIYTFIAAVFMTDVSNGVIIYISLDRFCVSKRLDERKDLVTNESIAQKIHILFII